MANHLKRDKQITIISMLTEGASIRSVERVTGVHRDTIMRLLVRVGNHVDALVRDRLTGVSASQLEIDELWAYVAKKQRRVLETDPVEYGDNYTFLGLDGVTKLVIHHCTGKRSGATTDEFMAELSRRVAGRTHIAVDGFECYPPSIRRHFPERADAMAVVKSFRSPADVEHRYSPPKVVGCIRYAIQGSPRRSKATTSHAERLNWSIRGSVRRLTRLSNGFSRRLANLQAAMSLFFAWYNFVKPHRALGGITPAMAAGVAISFWSVSDLLPN